MRNKSEDYQQGYIDGQASIADEATAERELPGGYYSCSQCGYSFLVDHEPRFCPWCGSRFVEVEEKDEYLNS